VHIFLDESGNFSGVGAGNPALSVQGALVLGSHRLPKLFARYAKLRHQLPKRNGEVKGSLLNETQVAAVIDLLRRNEALFFASVIDMGDHSEAEIHAHRAQAVQVLGANLTDGHTPELRAGVAQLQQRLAGFSIPLYAQARVTIAMLHDAMQAMILYHCQRNPKELAAFHWIVDGKDKTRVSDWENWWSETLVIWLQAMSLSKPGNLLPGGDYRYLQRFFFQELPAYLKDKAPKVVPGPAAGLDLQMMYRESFRFSSDPEPGLELVDIVTNALRRALIGNLGEEGWRPLRGLMLHRSDVYVSHLSLKATEGVLTQPYKKVLNQFRTGGRIMAAPNTPWGNEFELDRSTLTER
jgi:hypothetical protein